VPPPALAWQERTATIFTKLYCDFQEKSNPSFENSAPGLEFVFRIWTLQMSTACDHFSP